MDPLYFNIFFSNHQPNNTSIPCFPFFLCVGFQDPLSHKWASNRPVHRCLFIFNLFIHSFSSSQQHRKDLKTKKIVHFCDYFEFHVPIFFKSLWFHILSFWFCFNQTLLPQNVEINLWTKMIIYIHYRIGIWKYQLSYLW